MIFKFNKGHRDSYHTHAFNAMTWFIKGNLIEKKLNNIDYKYSHSIIPKITKRKNIHIVKAIETSWAFSLRGPWAKTWTQYNPILNKTTVLTWGRKIIEEYKGI